MSKRTVRSTSNSSRRDDESNAPDARLARLLDTPRLAQLTPQLASETLHQIIRVRGLEACEALLASATPSQLTAVLDLDLWRPAHAALDDEFDETRFGEWLEVLADAGQEVAARTIAAMNVDLVITGFARHIRVFDPGIFMPTAQSDDEPVEFAFVHDGALTCELGGYMVRGKDGERWDAIVLLLHALDTEQPERFHAVMRGCRRLSNDGSEIDGLDDLLDKPEQLLHDVAIDREHRRSARGYSTAADARAFLQMARQAPDSRAGASGRTNPIAAAYFRAVAEAETSDESIPRSEEAPDSAAAAGDFQESVNAVARALADAGLTPERPRALLAGAAPGSRPVMLVQRLLESVSESSREAYSSRTSELAFLANTLLAGCSIQSRAFTANEASDAAVSTCNLGLEHWPSRRAQRHAGVIARSNRELPDTFLIDHDLVTAFEVGWSLLYRDVSLFVTEQLVEALKRLHSIDSDIQRDLYALRRSLDSQLSAGTPWRARGALDPISMLDGPAWISLRGLLGECPVMPEALNATLEHRKGSISATEFEFISTASQIRSIHEFAGQLETHFR